jgi:hypothetical protein
MRLDFEEVKYDNNGEKHYAEVQEGEVDFEVLEAEEKMSASGNSMIELTMRVTDSHGVSSRVWDYLVATPATKYKIKAFCEVTGLINVYNDAYLEDSHCVGRIGRCYVNYEEYKGKKSLKVKFYCATPNADKKEDESQHAKHSSSPSAFTPDMSFDDDLPPF